MDCASPDQPASGEVSLDPPARRDRLVRLLGWTASAAIVAATVVLLRDRVGAVGELGGLPGPVSSTAVVGVFVGANLLLADTWWRVVRAGGAAIGRRDALWVWSASQLARYTVGAAQVAGRAVLGRRYGLSATAGAVTALVEIAWQVSITAALMLATIPWWLPGLDGYDWLAWLGVLPALILFAGLIAPQRLLAGVASVVEFGPLRRLTSGRFARIGRTRITRADAAAFTMRFGLNSALRLAGFAVLFVAVGGDLATHGLTMVGAYAAGQMMGRIAVFAPGGIGFRESATAILLGSAVGTGPVLVLVAGTRLLEVVAELLSLGVARLLRTGGGR